LLGPILFLICILWPTPPAMVEAARKAGSNLVLSPQLALGVLLWVGTWWITECVPPGVAALVAPIILSELGILSWRESLTSFMDPIIWIFIGGFALARCFQKWGLDKRIALTFSSLYKGNDPRIAAFFVGCLPAFILTMTGSITASTTIVLPVLTAYFTMLGVEKNARYVEGSLIAMAQAATSGAMLFLVSTPPNIAAKSFIERAVPGIQITFVDWLIVGTPHAIAGLLISWIVTFALMKPGLRKLPSRGRKLKVENLGPMSSGEKLSLLLLLLALGLWTFPGLMYLAVGSSEFWKPALALMKNLLPETMPAVLVLLLAGVLRSKGEPLLNWNDMLEGIDWSVIFLFGGGLALGTGIERSGLASWLVELISGALGGTVQPAVLFGICAVTAFLISFPASNTASALIVGPMAMALAKSAGLSPIPPLIAVALASSVSSCLPSTTPPMAIIYSSKRVQLRDMFRVGLISDLLRLTILLIVGPYLAEYLVSIKAIP